MRKKYTNHKKNQFDRSLKNDTRYPKTQKNTWVRSENKYHMIPNKKYEKNKITKFDKRSIIVRKGGYFPRRLYLTAFVFGILIAFFISLFALRIDLWFLFLFPMISLGLAVRYYYKRHIRFGEKISINKSRIVIDLYGSSNRKIQFRKGTIKSMTCTVTGPYYHFKIYKTNNSSMSFSIIDTKNQNPLSAILKFSGLEEVIETTSDDKTVSRYWSKSRNLKRKPREIENISESIYEYRSDYFSIKTEDKNLAIDIKGYASDEIYIDNVHNTIHYQTKNGSKGAIPFDDINSIEKIITETAPLNSTNRIKIRLIVKLNNNESIEIVDYNTHEALPANMEILDMNKDFDNLVAIIDMNIKASIDNELNKLDLDKLNKHHDQLLDESLVRNKNKTDQQL